jgi:hypothetical protein
MLSFGRNTSDDIRALAKHGGIDVSKSIFYCHSFSVTIQASDIDGSCLFCSQMRILGNPNFRYDALADDIKRILRYSRPVPDVKRKVKQPQLQLPRMLYKMGKVQRSNLY